MQRTCAVLHLRGKQPKLLNHANVFGRGNEITDEHAGPTKKRLIYLRNCFIQPIRFTGLDTATVIVNSIKIKEVRQSLAETERSFFTGKFNTTRVHFSVFFIFFSFCVTVHLLINHHDTGGCCELRIVLARDKLNYQQRGRIAK